MPIKFLPTYSISPRIANCLMKIEAVKERVLYLPLTATVLTSLRETARFYTTRYSTMIEGNRLNPDQIEEVLKHEVHFPGRERDEYEVKGYYAALAQVEQWVIKKSGVSEKIIQNLHALIMAEGKVKVKQSPYRDGQDVPELMKALVNWINNNDLPYPIVAGIAHYQFATIHPYYDGNGRTARLLTTLIMHLGGYDLKGLYSLEEYYARNLAAYYEAINIGVSHNYYMGRAQADITKWIEYFIEGVVTSFEDVLKRMDEAQSSGRSDQAHLLRQLDAKQRKALELFQEFETITASQLGKLFNFKPRTNAKLCKDWVVAGFIEIVDFSNKGRKYKLSKRYRSLI